MAASEKTSFDNFADTCAAQGVELDGEITHFGNNWYDNEIRDLGAYVPSAMLAAILAAGRIQRRRGDAIASSTIDHTADFLDDTPTRTLIGMINASIEPEPALPAEVEFKGPPAEFFNTCWSAEYKFMLTGISQKNMRPDGQALHGSQILHKDGAPIIIRKTLGNELGLTLRDIKINGLPVPVGSIVSVEFLDEKGASTPYPDDEAVECYDTDGIEKISFWRLSAFALTPRERADHGFRIPPIANDKEVEMFNGLEIQFFQNAAEDALAQLEQSHNPGAAASQ